MQQEFSKDTALVIEGGGFRGIYTAGVLEVLLKNKLFFNYAIGVSAGALYGVSYVSRQIDHNLKVNTYISDKRYSSIRNLLRDGSLFSWDFILREIPTQRVPFDYKSFSESLTKFWVGVTNCQTGQSEYFLLNPKSTDDFNTLISASCSLPFIAKKVAYDNKLYLDGGLSDSIPFEHALANGNHRALVILTRPKGYSKKPLKQVWFFKWIYRKTPKVAELLLNRASHYNQSIKKLEQLESQGKVFIIRPEKKIEVSRLENNPKKTEKVYYQAMEETEKQMAALRAWLKQE
jgi:predicted patatin/cPLA2 family phospholipase